MSLANSTLAQSYLAQGYQTQNTGIDYTLPAPPASSSAWKKKQVNDTVEWSKQESAGSP